MSSANRKENRLRLSKEEIDLIENLRNTGTLPSKYHINSEINASKLNGKYLELQKRHKILMNEYVESQIQLNTLIELQKYTDIKPMNFGKATVPESDATAFMIASDWHVEEKVDASTVNGLNTYNLDIAEKRATKFFEKGLFLTNLYRNGFKIERLVLALLGDFITGYIHEELMENNYLSPTEASLFVKKLICSGIKTLVKTGKFKEIIVPCCYGNHGRTSKEKKVSTASKNSFEWWTYKVIEQEFEKHPIVKVIVSDGYHNQIKLYNKYLLRFHHGDAIKFGGGIGGITIPANKAIAQWNMQQAPYLDVFGHFHQFIDNGKFISNGSLIGYNAYANQIKASYEIPQQAFFIIDKERGKVMTAPIFVD